MRTILLFVLISTLTVLFFFRLAASRTKAGVVERPLVRVLYTKALSDGRDLVVTEDPMVPVSVLKGLISPTLTDNPVEPIVGFTCINLELRSQSHAPLRLASQKYPLYSASEYDEYGVLDLLVLQDRIVLATVYPGSVLGMMEVGTPGQMRDAGLAGWSLLGASIPAVSGRLGATLAYDEKNQRIEVEVTDTLQGVRQHTQFRQTHSEWRFVLSKQWSEKFPKAP